MLRQALLDPGTSPSVAWPTGSWCDHGCIACTCTALAVDLHLISRWCCRKAVPLILHGADLVHMSIVSGRQHEGVRASIRFRAVFLLLSSLILLYRLPYVILQNAASYKITKVSMKTVIAKSRVSACWLLALPSLLRAVTKASNAHAVSKQPTHANSHIRASSYPASPCDCS
jgi:hypothetical protein